MTVLTGRTVLAGLGAAVAVFAGCLGYVSPQLERINARREIYEQWPIEIRQAVLEARVEAGMTPEMVTLAIGQPDAISRGADPDGEVIWVYRPAATEYLRIKPGVAPGNLDSLAGYNAEAVRSNNPVQSDLSTLPPIGSALPRGKGGPVEERTIVFRNGVVFHADPAPTT